MKGYKHLTQGEIDRVVECYRRTLSTVETSAETGYSLQKVRYTVKRAGIAPSGAKGGTCYRNRTEVERWAAEGVSLSEIARRIGTNHHRVSDFLSKHDFERTPFLQQGENNPAWKGGRMLDKDGYILIHMPEHPEANRHGYIREHRLVMEKTLGRPLLRSEVVHHKDDDTSNNDPTNLELFASNGEHLAATRTGRPANWTPEGRARILAAVRNQKGSRRTASQPESSGDDRP